MKRFILTIAAVAFVAVLGSTTNLEASPHKGGSSHGTVHAHVVVHSHHTLVVRGHSVDVRIHERGYRGWTSRCWLPGYRSYGYYCGTDQLWYYWYAPFNEYLPMSYISIYPPAQVALAPVGFAPVAPGMPALPPGATLVPGPITAP